jgi:hypothetical protein
MKPFPLLGRGRVGGAKRVEAVDEGDADVGFGGLAVGVSGADAVTQGCEASHLGLRSAPGVVAVPPLPSGATFFANVTEARVAGDC